MNPIRRTYTPVKKKTVLIVDDNQVVVHLYREKFQSQGFKVEVADNGNSAMQRLKSDPVDIVILDLCLPGMNGVDVLKNIRSEFDIQALAVIVFSNGYLGYLGRAALDAGATRCVVKADSTPDQIFELVRELLALDASPTLGASSGIASSNSEAPLAVQTELQETLALLLANAPAKLARLRISSQAFARAEQEDLKLAELREMHRQVRSLAGSAGLLGFEKIAQVANALEGLLVALQAKPKKITPSVMRTVAQSIDTLASLFDHAASPQAEASAPRRILVVDDEVVSREAICSALGKANLAAVTLDDSLTAQRLLEQDHFDLIFLDVEMPGLTGLELCVNIREMETNRATPVVFVTSHSDFGSRAQSTLSGGNDFIAKPFLLVELAVKALTWLFKEGPQLVAKATVQSSARVETANHEFQSVVGPGVLSVYEGSP